MGDDLEKQFRQLNADDRIAILKRLEKIVDEDTKMNDSKDDKTPITPTQQSSSSTPKSLFGSALSNNSNPAQPKQPSSLFGSAVKNGSPPPTAPVGNPFGRRSKGNEWFQKRTDGMTPGQGIFSDGKAPWTQDDVAAEEKEREKRAEAKARKSQQASEEVESYPVWPALLVEGESFEDFMAEESESALLTRNDCLDIDSHKECQQRVLSWLELGDPPLYEVPVNVKEMRETTYEGLDETQIGTLERIFRRDADRTVLEEKRRLRFIEVLRLQIMV